MTTTSTSTTLSEVQVGEQIAALVLQYGVPLVEKIVADIKKKKADKPEEKP